MKKNKGRDRGFRNLTSSALLVLVAFMLAVTATLAWFSMNISSRVNGILFEVTAEESLMIAVRQWKYKEVSVTRAEVTLVKGEADGESGELVYIYNGLPVQVAEADIYNIENESYAYISALGAARPEFVVAVGGKSYAYYDENGATQNLSLYSDVQSTTETTFLLSGYVLEEPEASDYSETVTKEDLAKVCMNNMTAEAITDTLYNGTTRIDDEGFATSITDIREKDGSGFRPARTAGGDRYTTELQGLGSAVAYKYEFELFFMSASQYALMLNTRKSGVKSENTKSSYIKAWDSFIMDNYTTDAALKSKYEAVYGTSGIITEGTELYTEAKNAVRIGFSDTNGAPIAVWDPNENNGWTVNDPEYNLALRYYNHVQGSVPMRAPAKSTLTADTQIISSMDRHADGNYYGSVRVTVWLEGYDADCMDSLLGETLDVSLTFAGLAL